MHALVQLQHQWSVSVATSSPSRNEGRVKVLLLLDDEDERRSYGSLLRADGHTIDEARTPEAVRAALASRFDCVVLARDGADGGLDLLVDVGASVGRRDAALRVRNSLRAAPSGSRPVRLGRVVILGGSRQVAVDGTPVHLSVLQYDVLEQLALSAGEVVTRDVLIERCWVEAGRTTGTPDLYAQISRLRSRLRGVLVFELIKDVGYRLTVPDV